MFGKLTLQDFVHDPIQNAANVGIVITALIVIGLLSYFKLWKWLWKEWITTLDPKKIGVMYIFVVLLMLVKGLIDAFMMRMQQMLSVGASQGYLEPDHFQQIFSAHGATMVFFVGMGAIFGLMNLVVPLQIGARDVAFPFLNATSFWFFAVGSQILLLSMMIGSFSAAGWLSYPPLSELQYSPDTGVDNWIWSLQIAGVGSLLGGINFTTTILKMRCKGMTLMKMPIFVWAILATALLIVFAFPILTATLALLTLDRLLNMHFFTSGFGGDPMLYINLIWAWGHPEVYILALPAFGIYSAIVPTFSKKRLFGYTSMVWAIGGITFISFIVWLHHFFIMGAGPHVNAFFGVATMLIAIPTGVKVFNWLFTMFRGRVVFENPMLWFLGFIFIFTTGGMSGVTLSIPPVDFQVHNSLFLVAHFHSVIIGGILFAFFAAYNYWFPKVFGFKLDRTLGRWSFYFWFFGFLAAFMPLYILGLMGATRRLNHYEASTGWHPFFIVAAVGIVLILCGLALQFAQLGVSILKRKEYRDTTGDPWDGRSLEWSTSSPPPEYNYAVIPTVDDPDPLWKAKQNPSERFGKQEYKDIAVPRNSAIPVLIGAASLAFGFAMTWQIFWLAAASFIGILVLMIIKLEIADTHFLFPKEEVEEIEREHLNRVKYA